MKATTYKTALGVAASLYANAVSTQASHSVAGDINFRWGVPESSASSGSGNVYFQMNASDAFQWVGLGIGTRMRGSDMFLLYQDGNGNVTLSTREASGHSEPQYSQRSAVELLEGSGVSDGYMVANVRCGDCGDLDLEGEGSWLAAWRRGDPLNSEDPEEGISVHSGKTVFQVNLGRASISSDENPFLNSTSDDDGDAVDGGSGGGSGSDSGDDSMSEDNMIILAHGIIMSIVFAFLYPLGSILMALLGKWIIHSTVQNIAFLAMWAGLALGVVFARRNGALGEGHAILGIIVVSLLGIQPVLGWLHHRHYLQHQGRGIISHIHVWYGRILMIVGVINGGLGLNLAGAGDNWVIAYSVVAAVMFVAYAVSMFFGSRRRKRSVEVKA